MIKKAAFAVVALLLFAISCQHKPEIVLPGGGGGGTNNPPVTNNCNPDSVYFENDILPLLTSNCGVPGCHDAATQTEGINVTSYAALMASDIVRAGNPGNSDLIEVINETNPGKRMPQPPRPALTPEQIQKLTKWVQQGAKNNKCNSGCDTTKFTFSAGVKPIIDLRCKGCHGPTAPSAGISLDTYSGVKAQVDNGKLLPVITHAPGAKQMPQGTAKMPDCEITIIQKWVNAGAANN